MAEGVKAEDEAMTGDMVVDVETITMDDQSKGMRISSLMRSLTNCRISNESGSLLGMLQLKEKGRKIRTKDKNQELLLWLVLDVMRKAVAWRRKVMANLLITAC